MDSQSSSGGIKGLQKIERILSVHAQVSVNHHFDITIYHFNIIRETNFLYMIPHHQASNWREDSQRSIEIRERSAIFSPKIGQVSSA